MEGKEKAPRECLNTSEGSQTSTLCTERFSPEKRKEVKAANREQARASRKRRNDMSAIDTLF